MGFCTSRKLLLTICILQLIALFERQVFEFLGFLWIPILLNFLEIIFVIFGFFGAYQYRPKYIASYLVWHAVWLAWNVYIICLYLDIGVLDHKESSVIKIDQWSESWWVKNGPGCRVELNVTHPHPSLENVVNCYVDYRYVEIFQAGLQTTLALLGLITGFCLSRTFLEEDDSSSHKRKNAKRMSLYSIEFSPQHDRGDSDSNDYDGEAHPQAISPKPMTPRRVKRRSVMQRGTTSRHSTTSRRHNNHAHTNPRSSTRSSRRSVQNPVTRLIDQQAKMAQAQYDQFNLPSGSMDLSYHDYHMMAAGVVAGSNSVSTNNLVAHAHHLPPGWSSKGHANPTYQQSSSQSLNEHDDFEELFTNRPPSARSSYSNFHGTRAISYAHAQQQPPYPQHPQNSVQQHQHSTIDRERLAQEQQYAAGGYNQATSQAPPQPQVPQKINTHRGSLRSKAFLNNGPPAYTPHGHAHNHAHIHGHAHSPPLDSETAI